RERMASPPSKSSAPLLHSRVMPFKLRSDYKPQGDQPRAIAELTAGIKRGDKHQTLLGVTGSGKTFTVANVVSQVQKPTLVIAHNKTLAGQLYVEIQYERNDHDFSRGTFRVKGDTIEIFPAYEEERAIRVELFGDMVESIKEIDPLRGKVLGTIEKMSIFPSSHYVTSGERRKSA